MSKIFIACSLISVSLTTAAASDQQLDKVLTGRFHEKVVRLRLPSEQNSQEYNAEGQPLTAASVGPWAAYGGIVVNKIVIESNPPQSQPGSPTQVPSTNQQLIPFPWDQKVAHLGDAGITAPKILFKPEPEFSDSARKLQLKGVAGLQVVVDDAGTVSDRSIVKPMGAGLDENAVNTVRRWRFSPATKDGRPVAVAVYIEVDFNWSY